MDRVSVIESMFGKVRGVHRVTKGHSFAAAASIDETVLTLNEVSDFDEAGGQVMVSGLVYDYTTIDESANTITLATGLTVAAAVDDPADVFDPVVGSIAVVGYEAEVMLDDADPSGRSITVSVQHGLVPMLEESVRGESAEAVTLVRDGEHDWMIWQVDGKLAVDLLADAAAEAAASAADLALEALTAAELAEAIIDGYIEYYYQTTMPWPTGDLSHEDDFGDVWVDTDSTPQAAYRWRNDRTWTLITDNSLVEALFAAQNAQVTADGKITHYVGTWALPAGPPPEDGVAHSYGDIYTKTDEDNLEYYWDGNSWEALLVGDDAITTTLTGKLIRTAASGQRVEISSDPELPDIRFYSTTDARIAGLEPYFFNDGVNPVIAGVSIAATGGTTMYVTNNRGVLVSGGVGMEVVGEMKADIVKVTAVTTTGLAANVRINGSGELVESTSSKRYKKNIRAARLDLDAFVNIKRRSWQSKCPGDGPRRMVGFIAEEVHDAGLIELVTYDEDGAPKAIQYSVMVTHLHALAERQQAQIDAQQAQIDDLEARLSRLESKGN